MAEDDQGGQWLNLTEAAHRLGWSRERLRSHARRGRMRTMRGNSGELLVLVTSDLTGVAGPGRSDRGGRTRAVKAADRSSAEAAQQAERWRALAEERGRALARAEGELAAGQRTEAALRELVDELKAQLARERSRRHDVEVRLARPWWRRWLG
jgi:hypothetical protein